MRFRRPAPMGSSPLRLGLRFPDPVGEPSMLCVHGPHFCEQGIQSTIFPHGYGGQDLNVVSQAGEVGDDLALLPRDGGRIHFNAVTLSRFVRYPAPGSVMEGNPWEFQRHVPCYDSRVNGARNRP
jgi:hypothetical protein